MSKKNQEKKAGRFVSKHQLSKWQRQKRLRNITMGAGLAVIVAVVVIVGLGFYNSEIRPYTRTAIRVNNATFSVRYLINMLRLYGGGSQDLPQDIVADQVISIIEQQELIRQGAVDLGMQVKRSDIVAELKKNEQPATKEIVDIQTASALIDKLRTDYFKPKVAANQPQVNVQAMLLESQDAAQQAVDRLKAGEAFDTLADALSKEGITKSKKGDLEWLAGHEADLLITSDNVGNLMLAAPTGISGPYYDDSVVKDYGYWVIKVLEKTDASADGTTPKRVHVEGILTGSPADAQSVIEKLKSGEDFATLAKEVSLQPGVKEGASSPDLGWTDYSDSLTDYQKSLFDLPLSEFSGPLADSEQQTKGGYWVFNILEKDGNKALTDQQMSVLVGDLVNKWAEGLPKDSKNKIEVVMSNEQKQFAILQALG